MSVYFIKDERDRVKIGQSYDPEGRRDALQTAHADRLEIARKIDGGRPTERWLHHKFSDRRITGEWFQFCDEMLTIVPPNDESLKAPSVKNALLKLAKLRRRVNEIRNGEPKNETAVS
jgi:Meiotically up-regulated gene 113